MALSNFAVLNAKGRGKSYKLTDGNGLYLLVSPEGRRYWRKNYRFEGSQRTLSLGVYPEVGLALARERCLAASKLIASGIDPGDEKKRVVRAAKIEARNTFQAVADEWLQKVEREGRSEVTLGKLRWLLSFAFPSLGKRKIGKISPPELLAVLRVVEQRGHFETARRLRSTCGQIFRYAVATGRAERDPSADLKGAITSPKVRHRAAILEPAPAGHLLRSIETYSGYAVTKAALQIAPHVFVRPGELRAAEWQEIDLDQSIWVIPAAKTKMRIAHRVPLSRQVVEVLRSLFRLTGQGTYAFPVQGGKLKPMCENTINLALRRMGFDQNTMTAHGFRAMASTLLNEQGIWHPDAIERQLGHKEVDEIRGAYARGSFWNERVKMMQHWSDYLDELRFASAG